MRMFEIRQRPAKLPGGEQYEPTQPHTARRLRIEREDPVDTLLRAVERRRRTGKPIHGIYLAQRGKEEIVITHERKAIFEMSLRRDQGFDG